MLYCIDRLYNPNVSLNSFSKMQNDKWVVNFIAWIENQQNNV